MITVNSADQPTSGSVGSVAGHQQPALNIYDASGRVVKSFNVGSLLVAHRSLPVTWNGCDDRGQRLPAGVYVVRFTADDHQETQKLVRLR
jgi:flagellar hook assembly protein FlgD